MEDTCRGESCWFYILIQDLVGGVVAREDKVMELKNCPFYMEMIFTPQEVGEKVQTAKVVKDCSNKRSLLFLLESVHPRLVGVQQANEEARDKSAALADVMVAAINIATAKNRIQISSNGVEDNGIIQIEGTTGG
jgi:hypothetical protein